MIEAETNEDWRSDWAQQQAARVKARSTGSDLSNVETAASSGSRPRRVSTALASKVNEQLNERRRRGRITKRAAILDQNAIRMVEQWIETKSLQRERDLLIFYLQLYAALRACEVARLQISHMTNARGVVNKLIWICPGNSKNGRERFIPMHPKIHKALLRFLAQYPTATYVAVRRDDPTSPIRVNTLTTYVYRMFENVGLKGCSSHSGRRTCLSTMAQGANRVGSSLKDVQGFAGHARLETTECYIEPSTQMAELLSLLQ